MERIFLKYERCNMKRYKSVFSSNEISCYPSLFIESLNFQEGVLKVDNYVDIVTSFLIEAENDIFIKKESRSVVDILNDKFYFLSMKFIQREKTKGKGFLIKGKTIQNGDMNEIHIYFDFDSESLKVNKQVFHGFINSVQQVIYHELVHRFQLLRTNIEKFKTKNISNITDKYELMAYAFNIVQEFRFNMYYDDEIKKMISSKNSEVSYILNEFRKLQDSSLLNQLYKYIYLYLE